MIDVSTETEPAATSSDSVELLTSAPTKLVHLTRLGLRKLMGNPVLRLLDWWLVVLVVCAASPPMTRGATPVSTY